MTESITTSTTASAKLSGTGSFVELRVDLEGVHFVPGVIPDGQLAGQRGHFEQSWTGDYTFHVSPTNARRLRDELNAALGET